MNVEGCSTHTALDQHGTRFRTQPCNAACRIWADAHVVSPLTKFLAKLITYKDGDVAKADPKKAAEHYGIREDWAEGYIRMERVQRGLSHGDAGRRVRSAPAEHGA